MLWIMFIKAQKEYKKEFEMQITQIQRYTSYKWIKYCALPFGANGTNLVLLSQNQKTL